MSVISVLGQDTVFVDVTDSERLEHTEIGLGVLGDEVDSGLEADFEGRGGLPRCGFRFYPLGSGECTEVLKQWSNSIILTLGMLTVANCAGPGGMAAVVVGGSSGFESVATALVNVNT